MIVSEDDQPIQFSRAFLAVVVQELDRQIELGKFKNRSDFAIKCFLQKTGRAFFSELILGKKSDKLNIPKIDIDMADRMTKLLNLNFAETIMLAEQMVKNGNFPYGEIANLKSIRKWTRTAKVAR